ncbi:MAG: hypothetical protein IJM62_03150, partial [Lachnospiraceae bacterium]|nr:hypothetical protein [Lachnospiraceae bacterium]
MMYRKIVVYLLCFVLFFTNTEVAFSNPREELTLSDEIVLKNTFEFIKNEIIFSVEDGTEDNNAKEENPEIVISGSCGDNATYTLYKNGQLVISGQGATYDY